MSIQSSKSTQSVPPKSDVLEEVSRFLASYLHCSHHQLTVLALWVLHTYCADAAQVTPYLSIQSTHKQSGKTLCLHLLQLLCNYPALATGLPASHLNKLLHGPNCTILIDECQATLGTRTRSKAPALRAFLTSGFQKNPEFFGTLFGHNAFRPKVFAGMGHLPEQLADRSIPIILEPIQNRVAQSHYAPNRREMAAYQRLAPGSQGAGLQADVSEANQPSAVSSPKIARFNLRQAEPEAKQLREQLQNWAEEHLPILNESDPYPEEAFPPKLSPRRQDMIEPLLQLADAVGGQWPARIREAVTVIFEEGAAFDLQPSLQVLSELHRCFFHYSFPERLSTSVMIEWLQAVPNRPWETEGQINAARLARLLYPFEIRPRVLRMGKHGNNNEDKDKDQHKSNFARGYPLEEFLEPWRRHLNFIVPGKTHVSQFEAVNHPQSPLEVISFVTSALQPAKNAPVTPEEPTFCHAGKHPNSRGLPTANCQLPVAAFPEIVDKDAGCYAVTHDGESSSTGTNPSVPCGLSPVPCSTAVTRDVSTSNGHTKIAPQSAKTDEKIPQARSNPPRKNRVNGAHM